MANTKISEMTAATTVGVTDVLPIVQGGVNKKATKEVLKGYKVYTALMSQSGTSAPTVSILENTIGNIVWTYNAVGVYDGTLMGTFLSGKVVCFISGLSLMAYQLDRGDDDAVLIQVRDFGGAFQDSQLVDASIEIRVYP